MTESHIGANLAILMPKMSPNSSERFKERYSGLVQSLGDRGLSCFFAENHNSFDKDNGYFSNVFDVNKNNLAMTGYSNIVRDLTMSLDNKPLYNSGLQIVHTPEFNRFVADKQSIYRLFPELHPKTICVQAAGVLSAIDDLKAREVVIKPSTGQQSEGVVLIDKQQQLTELNLNDGNYLVQEYIDTSGGIPELGVRGVHNLRMISIGRQVIGAIVRDRGTDPKMLRQDSYGKICEIDEIPEGFMNIANRIHDGLVHIKGSDNSVIAIDVMRGIDSNGEVRDVLCEVNRRPVRISPYDLHDNTNRDNNGLLRLSNRWDNAEADMLERLM